MPEKYTTARLTVEGEHFEILVKPEAALDYKMGKKVDIRSMLVIDEIFTDSGKGMRASEGKLQETFNTLDRFKIAEEVLKRGELQLTTEQRRELIESKRKQIVAFIRRYAVDPKTGLPHPPTRIEQAMEKIHLSINPFGSTEEQARAVIDALRPIIPIKIEEIRIAVKIPSEHAAKAYGAVKEFGNIARQEWQADGSWIGIVELPAGLHGPLVDRLGKLTQGTAQTKMLK